MGNDEGAGFVDIEVFGQGTQYILGDGIIISEDALEVSIFNAICEVKKKL